MFFLNLRMYVLIGLMFGMIYAIVSMIAFAMGVQDFMFYAVFTFVLIFIQYMVGPWLIELSMRVRYVKKEEQPQLFAMIEELAKKANIPMPRVGISSLPIPNAFAYGRWLRDGRVCLTQGILNLLNKEELKAVLGHELSHLKNRDVLTITLLSVIPLILYRIAFYFLFYGGGRSRKENQNTALIGLVALIFYFITNLLVLYGSRIREYFADRGSVVLGNQPQYLASALYKLVYGSARARKDDLREVQGLKAFFINDPSRALFELKELSQLDIDKSGSIDNEELKILQSMPVKLGTTDKAFELFSTHPNMLKRIKQLSTYVKV